MENKEEWTIVPWTKGYGIKHKNCCVFGASWETRSYSTPGDCCGCGKQIPKHFRLQLDLLSNE